MAKKKYWNKNKFKKTKGWRNQAKRYRQAAETILIEESGPDGVRPEECGAHDITGHSIGEVAGEESGALAAGGV